MNEYLDVVLRSAAVYLFMLGAIRLFGKKELSQLNTADIILILLISNAVQNAMVGQNTSLLGGLAAAAALFIINFIFKKLMYRSKKLQNILEEKPVILVHHGKVDLMALHQLEITLDELNQAIREHGLEDYKAVKLAMMEVDGTISVISGDDNLKVTHFKRRRKQKSLTKSLN